MSGKRTKALRREWSKVRETFWERYREVRNEPGGYDYRGEFRALKKVAVVR